MCSRILRRVFRVSSEIKTRIPCSCFSQCTRLTHQATLRPYQTPRLPQERQKRWGEISGYRQELAQRNQRIKEEYQSGISMECLSEKYCLSLYAVRKIIYQK